MTLIEQMIKFITALLHITTAQATTWAVRARNGVQQIFVVSFGMSLFLILIGFGMNSAGTDGSWLITTGSIISFISLIIALFVFMGPAWGILLIIKNTTEETQEFFKKYVLAVIMWVSLVNVSFLILPTVNWGLQDVTVFIFAVIIAALASVILGKQPKLVYEIAFAIGIFIILILIGKIIFPVTINNITNYLFVPANQQMIGLTQTWWGALAVVLSLFLIIPWLTNFVRRMNGEEKKDKAFSTATEKTKRKIWPGIKSIGLVIMTIAFFFIFLLFVWWGVSKMQPTWTANVSQIAGAGWAKGKSVVSEIQVPTISDVVNATPVTPPVPVVASNMPQPQKKTGKFQKGGNIKLRSGKFQKFQADGYPLSFSKKVKISYNKKDLVILNPGQEILPTSDLFVAKLSATNVHWSWKQN